MGSSRTRHSSRAARRRGRESGTQSLKPDLPALLGAIADGLAVIETAIVAIEAAETHASAAVTLHLGLRRLLDAYAGLNKAGNVA